MADSVTTVVVPTTDLVGVQSIVFIRPQPLQFTVKNARPNIRIYPYFDGIPISQFCRFYVGENYTDFSAAMIQQLPPNPTAGNPTPAMLTVGNGYYVKADTNISVSNSAASNSAQLVPPMYPGSAPAYHLKLSARSIFSQPGAPIYTNAAGEATVWFDVPASTFRTGNIQVMFTDSPNMSNYNLPGSVFGSAVTTFSSAGTTEYFQTTYDTITTITQTVVQMMPDPDPLAQSFFTYGATGGIFLIGIDLFFATKDPSTPVKIEIRNLVNGTPDSNPQLNPDLICVVNPSDIVTSQDSSQPTRFNFRRPIYLQENKEYAFVVLTNCSTYNLYTSMLGEKSIETGFMIYDQPYVGSMFKSENSITWTPEQYEDIKFNLVSASFNTTAAGSITLTGSSPSFIYFGDSFTTTTGSSVIRVSSNRFHGLQQSTSSKVGIVADSFGTYNGIPGGILTNTFSVTNIIDDFTFEFDCGSAASITGEFQTCGAVRGFKVLNGGSNYTNPTILISSPAAGGTVATGSAIVAGGVIQSITVTNNGTKYSTTPTVTITDTTGSGAIALAITDANLLLTLNTVMDAFTPVLNSTVPPGTSITSTIKSIGKGYSFLPDESFDRNSMHPFTTSRVVASEDNRVANLSSYDAVSVTMNLTSSNSRISPVIKLGANSGLLAYTNEINDQGFTENLAASTATSGVISAAITVPGSGYTDGTVNCTVIPAQLESNVDGITPATVQATFSGGVLTALVITQAGSGYTRPPLLVIAPPASGNPAAGTLSIAYVNSELMTSGNSYSRYITKQVNLETVSTGIHVYVTAYSTADTSFDWYVRTSLSSSDINHDSAPWIPLKCDVDRNASANPGEFHDYEFYADSVPKFDTFNMKMVPSSRNRAIVPYIKKYRAIVVV